LHAALSTQLPELAAKWVLQWQTAISRDALGIGGRDEQVASDVVTVLLAGLAVGDEEPGASISVGLRFGAQAFEQGVSLYHTEWGVDLLAAMVMSAMETATAGTVTQSGGVTDGIRLAHRLQRRVALLSRAARGAKAVVIGGGLLGLEAARGLQLLMRFALRRYPDGARGAAACRKLGQGGQRRLGGSEVIDEIAKGRRPDIVRANETQPRDALAFRQRNSQRP